MDRKPREAVLGQHQKFGRSASLAGYDRSSRAFGESMTEITQGSEHR
jgi:alkylated DNA nucleotide flippase Atl1